MKITRVVTKQDGNIDAVMSLTSSQVTFLLNVGLAVLLQQGAAEFVDVPSFNKAASDEATIEVPTAPPTETAELSIPDPA